MKKIMFMVVACFALFASCSSEDNTATTTEQQNDGAIAFGTYINKVESRGSLAGEATLKEKSFYVYANVINPNASKATPLMEGQQIKYVNNSWTYSPVKYWPTDQDETVDFYAVGPKDDNTTTEYDWNYMPQTTFYINKDVKKQTDFLWASPLLGKKRSDFNGSVTFNFQHALTAYAFTIKSSENEAIKKLKVNSITITGYFAPKATVDPKEVDINKMWNYRGDWAKRSYTISTENGGIDPDLDFNSSTPQYVVKDNNTVGHYDNTPTDVKNDSCDYFMLLPYQANMTYTVKLNYTITTNDKDGNGVNRTYEVEKDVDLAENKPGKLIVNNIDLSLKEIKISADVTNWNSQSEGGGESGGGGGSATDVKVASLTVTPATFTLDYNGTKQLLVAVSPSNATNKAVTWSSNNTDVATVASNGLVTAGNTAGTATITATAADGSGKTATAEITVAATKVNVTGLTVSPTTLSLKTGETKPLSVTVTPDDATNKTVTWSSNNTSVATVDESGNVKGIAAGTATITATSDDDNNIKATATITVTEATVKVTSLTVTPDTKTLNIGENQQLTVTVAPTDATNKTVTWSSDKKNVATVDDNGKVTAVAAGKATITATAKDGSGKTAAATITVIDPNSISYAGYGGAGGVASGKKK